MSPSLYRQANTQLKACFVAANGVFRPRRASTVTEVEEDEPFCIPDDVVTIGPVELNLLEPFPYLPDLAEPSIAGPRLAGERRRRLLFLVCVTVRFC